MKSMAKNIFESIIKFIPPYIVSPETKPSMIVMP